MIRSIRLLRITIAVMLASIGYSVPCRADLILTFSSDGTTPLFNVSSNSRVDVPIYLMQRGLETRLTDFGIVSFGVKGTFSPGLASIDGFTFASPFPDFQDFSSSASDFRTFGNVKFNAGGPNPGLQATTGNSILLGTLHIQTLGVGTTTIKVGDYDPSSPSFSDFSFAGAASADSLDNLLFNDDAQKTYAFSITQTAAVPEPNCLLLVTIVGCIVAFRARSKSKHQNP